MHRAIKSNYEVIFGLGGKAKEPSLLIIVILDF